MFGKRRLVCAQDYCICPKDARACGSNISSSCDHIHFRSLSASIIRIKAISKMDWQCRCVEMVYGICVMGSVNDGDVKFKDLAQAMYQFFGVKAKDCYRFYTDIRRRKNYSRTYFLDKMQEKLNEKMRRDDELERMRR
ncbi:RteC domain-containing protein [Segatella copri]|uniref:RteC domain-containing protein n=1 Tax=Segatella copri TaxID=165179 RepID=UPI003981EA09